MYMRAPLTSGAGRQSSESDEEKQKGNAAPRSGLCVCGFFFFCLFVCLFVCFFIQTKLGN